MRCASALISKFDKMAGYTLGSLTSSLPEVAIIILALAPSRPMIPLLSLPLSDELRASVKRHADATVGANNRGSREAAEVADRAQRASPMTSYYGGAMMKELMGVVSSGGAFVDGTVLNHHSDSLVAHIIESLVTNANQFLSAFTKYAAAQLGAKGTSRGRGIAEPKDIKSFAAEFGIVVTDQSDEVEFRENEWD
eukprot:6486022-Amphidinium_carterae.1